MWSQERDGKTRYFERYTDPLTGKQKTISVTLERSGKKAEKEAREILMDRIRELTSDPYAVKMENRTLGQLRDLYMDYLTTAVDPSTKRGYSRSLGSVLSILDADTLYGRLTPLYITKAFLDTGKSAGTLNGYLTYLKMLLRWAYRNDLIPDNSIVEKLKPFKTEPHRLSITDKYLEKDEVQKVLDLMVIPEHNLLTRFFILSGLRFGEFCALERSDIDFKAHCIHVTKSFNSADQEVKKAKNSSSIRDVHMQPELEAVCHEMMDYVSTRKIVSKIFFPKADGGHTSYDTYHCYLYDKALLATGKKITPHALRHTHASLLFEAGHSYEEVQRRLGHSTDSVTREIYVHITKKLVERDNEKLDRTSLLS